MSKQEDLKEVSPGQGISEDVWEKMTQKEKDKCLTLTIDALSTIETSDPETRDEYLIGKLVDFEKEMMEKYTEIVE